MRSLKKNNRAQRSNGDLSLSSSKNVRLVEKKHEQIVKGACRIFFKKGHHPITIRMIAKACGMSMGQLYHYIYSKDDVLYLVHKYMQKVWCDYLKNSGIEKIEDPLQRLTEALRHTIEFMIKNKRLIQFIYTESKYLDKKHLRVVLDMDYKSVIGFWRGLLKEMNKEESIKGNSDFWGSLIAYLMVFLPLKGWTLRNRPTKKTLDALVDFTIKGLGISK